MSIFIGCDLGGTNIKAGIVDIDSGKILQSASVPTMAQDGHEKVIEHIIKLTRSIITNSNLKKSDILGLGISAPGLLDANTGNTLFLPNLPGQWRNIPLGKILASALDLPVTILNDVRAITYGEYKFGGGEGLNRMACLAIGTGLGGGLVIDGKLILGFDGTAGEFGHQTVEMNGIRCSCGNYGCLEAYTSGPAISSRAARAVRQGYSTRISEIVDYDLNKITPKIVAEAAHHGDELALEIWDSVGQYLGTGIANICVSFGPERVVLSGGVAAAGELLIKPIKRTLIERVHVMPIDRVEIVTSTLGIDAGILGMASWAGSSQSTIGLK